MSFDIGAPDAAGGAIAGLFASGMAAGAAGGAIVVPADACCNDFSFRSRTAAEPDWLGIAA